MEGERKMMWGGEGWVGEELTGRRSWDRVRANTRYRGPILEDPKLFVVRSKHRDVEGRGQGGGGGRGTYTRVGWRGERGGEVGEVYVG